MSAQFEAEQKLLIPDGIEWQKVVIGDLPARLEPGMVVTGLATMAVLDRFEEQVVQQIVQDGAEDAYRLNKAVADSGDDLPRVRGPKHLNSGHDKLSSALRDAGFCGRLSEVRAAIIPYDDKFVRKSADVKDALLPIRGLSMLLAAQVKTLGGRPKAELNQEVSYFGRLERYHSTSTINRVLPTSSSVDSWQEVLSEKRVASMQYSRLLEAWRLAAPVRGGSPGLGLNRKR